MGLWSTIRSKHLERWLPGYARHLARSLVRPRVAGLRHLLVAVCDHFEPQWEKPDAETALARVRAWHQGYPMLAEGFRDADGRPPQHSFFFPGEEYQPQYFDLLDALVRDGFGEVELHLHHDNSTASQLRDEIVGYLDTYAARGHLARTGDQIRYAFIHGNWALANGRPDGRYCGVDEELPLLFETGCYADFTFPCVPDPAQANIVNQIYWPTGDLARRRAYEHGREARVGHRYDDRILLITGPLAVTQRGRGLRLEYGALTARDPPTRERVRSWVEQNVHVVGQPDWVFVKLYTHGAPEAQAASLLGDGGRNLHEGLRAYNDGQRWKLHYVTAREMFNIARAAMAGETGDPGRFRDYVLAPPPIVQGTMT